MTFVPPWTFRSVAAISCLLWITFTGSDASALSLSLNTDWHDQSVSPGETITVELTLDTDGDTGMTSISAGILFDDAILEYRRDLSSTTSYLLWNGTTGDGYIYPTKKFSELRNGATDHINVDFLSRNYSTTGTEHASGLAAKHTGTVAGGRLAILIFEVIAAGDGIGEISLSITAAGNGIGSATGQSHTTLIAGSGQVLTTATPIPESGTALLMGLGLIGIALCGNGRNPESPKGIRREIFSPFTAWPLWLRFDRLLKEP